MTRPDQPGYGTRPDMVEREVTQQEAEWIRSRRTVTMRMSKDESDALDARRARAAAPEPRQP